MSDEAKKAREQRQSVSSEPQDEKSEKSSASSAGSSSSSYSAGVKPSASHTSVEDDFDPRAAEAKQPMPVAAVTVVETEPTPPQSSSSEGEEFDPRAGQEDKAAEVKSEVAEQNPEDKAEEQQTLKKDRGLLSDSDTESDFPPPPPQTQG